MSTAIQFGERQLTIDLISHHLTTSSLLPQVLREMVVDEILVDSQIEIDLLEVEATCDRLAQLPMYQGFDRSQLIPIANLILKLQKSNTLVGAIRFIVTSCSENMHSTGWFIQLSKSTIEKSLKSCFSECDLVNTHSLN